MKEIYRNPINYFWIGSRFSPIEILSFKSCLKNGMTPILWCYETIENLPKGVILKDANQIIPEEKIKYYLQVLKLPIPSVSDFFRYELLYQIGGIYSDTDIVFLKNLYLIKIEEYFCSTYEYNYNECASNCLMRLKKGSIVGKFLIDEAYNRLKSNLENKNQDIHYCEFGPFVVQHCARELPIEILNYDIINPISWRWTEKLIAYEKFDIKFHIKQLIRSCFPFWYENKGYFLTKNTIAVHLCNEVWTKNGIDKHKPQHRLSLFEKLKNKI